MMRAILTLDEMPKACDKCPLFVNRFGTPAYCIMGAEYMAEEIAKEKDGNLTLYYHGCLSGKPAKCPLKAENEI